MRKNHPVGPVAMATPAPSPQAPACGVRTCQLVGARPSSRHRARLTNKGAPVPVGSVRWIPARCALARTGSQRRPTAGRRARQALSPAAPDKGSSVRIPPSPGGILSSRSFRRGGTAEGVFLGVCSPSPLPAPHLCACGRVAARPQPVGAAVRAPLLPPRLRAPPLAQGPSPRRAPPLAQGPLAAHQGLRGLPVT